MEISKATILSAKPEIPLQLSLSVSKVKTFKDCKAKYRFSYIEKLPKKDWEHLTFGKAIHEILENFHKKIIEGNENDFNDLMVICFQQSLTNWPTLTAEQKTEAWEMLKGYLKLLDDQQRNGTLPNVLSVEKDFFIDIDGKVLLNGFIDRVQLDADGVLHCLDYKTTKNKKYLKNDWFQLLTYAYVLCLEDPSIQKVRGSYMLLRHGFESITKEFSREEIMTMETKFLDQANCINEEKLFRASPSPLCNFCDFSDVCESSSKFTPPKKAYGAVSW